MTRRYSLDTIYYGSLADKRPIKSKLEESNSNISFETLKADDDDAFFTLKERGHSFTHEFLPKSLWNISKFICVFIVYFTLMSIAIVYAFQSITSLINSYNNPINSVEYQVVKEYDPPAILIYPALTDKFVSCEMLFDLDSRRRLPNTNSLCIVQNFSYFSNRHNETRIVHAFKGPSDVYNGERLKIILSLNLTVREESINLEYRVFSDWNIFDLLRKDKSIQDIANEIELNNPISQLAGGYSNFISLDKTIANKLNGDKIIQYIQTSHIAPLVNKRNFSELIGYIEWSDSILETSSEIPSTTVWNTLGSLLVIFLALGKVTDYAKYWILKFQRTRRRHIEYKMIMKERNGLIQSIRTNETNNHNTFT